MRVFFDTGYAPFPSKSPFDFVSTTIFLALSTFLIGVVVVRSKDFCLNNHWLWSWNACTVGLFADKLDLLYCQRISGLEPSRVMPEVKAINPVTGPAERYVGDEEYRSLESRRSKSIRSMPTLCHRSRYTEVGSYLMQRNLGLYLS